MVGTVVSMRAQKALDVLVDAFAELLDSLPDAHLLLVGDGERREEVEAHVRLRGVAERVHFTGNRPDVPDFIAAFDVSVLSSDFEGTPLFVFESMAQGTAGGGHGGRRPARSDRGRPLGRARAPSGPARRWRARSRRSCATRSAGRRSRRRAASACEDFTLERAAERFAALYEELLR